MKKFLVVVFGISLVSGHAKGDEPGIKLNDLKVDGNKVTVSALVGQEALESGDVIAVKLAIRKIQVPAAPGKKKVAPSTVYLDMAPTGSGHYERMTYLPYDNRYDTRVVLFRNGSPSVLSSPSAVADTSGIGTDPLVEIEELAVTGKALHANVAVKPAMVDSKKVIAVKLALRSIEVVAQEQGGTGLKLGQWSFHSMTPSESDGASFSRSITLRADRTYQVRALVFSSESPSISSTRVQTVATK